MVSACSIARVSSEKYRKLSQIFSVCTIAAAIASGQEGRPDVPPAQGHLTHIALTFLLFTPHSYTPHSSLFAA